jgi:SAM-dependent methyltransferase
MNSRPESSCLRYQMLTLSSKTAATYASEPWHKDLINKTHEFVLANLSWLGVDFIDPSTAFEAPSGPSTSAHQVRVLDYACGPGTITSILAGHATEFVGIDLSENMVKAYNERFAATSDDAPTLNARAVVGDLLDPAGTSSPLSGPEFHNFDLAAIGFGFHHFDDLSLATERLVARLKPGSVFLIADFVTHAKVANNAQHNIAHHGFGEEEVHKIFGGAGLVDIGFLKIPGPVKMVFKGGDGGEHHRQVFLAKGKKPEA